MSPADIARISGFIIREVGFQEDPKKYGMGPFLVLTGKETIPVVCYKRHGQLYGWRSDAGKSQKIHLDRNDPSSVFYTIHRSLPSGVVTWRDMFRFALRDVRAIDILTILAVTMLAAYASLQNSTLMNKLFGTIIPYGQPQEISYLTAYVLAWSVGNLIFGIARALATFRMNSRMKYTLTCTLYDRLFHMEEAFFRTGESAQIVYRVDNLPPAYLSVITAAGDCMLMVIFAWIYIRKMASYSSALTVISVACAFVGMGAMIAVGKINQKNQMAANLEKARMRSGLFQMLTNMQTSAFLAFLSASAAFTGATTAVAQSVLTYLLIRPVLKNSADILKRPILTAAVSLTVCSRESSVPECTESTGSLR